VGSRSLAAIVVKFLTITHWSISTYFYTSSFLPIGIWSLLACILFLYGRLRIWVTTMNETIGELNKARFYTFACLGWCFEYLKSCALCKFFHIFLRYLRFLLIFLHFFLRTLTIYFLFLKQITFISNDNNGNCSLCMLFYFANPGI